MLTPKSRDWRRLESRRRELRARLLLHPLSDAEQAELERVTATLNAAYDAAFPGLRPWPAEPCELPPT